MRILIAGATSALGHATASALLESGHHVIAVGSNADRLGMVDASERFECDLTDPDAVRQLGAEVGELDGLLQELRTSSLASSPRVQWLARRCIQLQEHGALEGWTGVHHLGEK